MAAPKIIGPDDSLSDYLRGFTRPEVLEEGHNTIRKLGSRYRLVSSKGRNLGTFKSRAQAERREKQVTFFRNLKKSRGGPGSLRAKVRKRSLLK